MKRLIRSIRVGTAAVCAALTLCTVLPASAKDVSLDCTYIPITGNGFVADVFNGVEARYNTTGGTLFCDDVVRRYYRDVYGLEIQTGNGVPVVMNNSDLYFAKTDTPRPGDPLYASAAAREKGSGHWAMVKSVDGDTMTLFEQNWVWNGQAGINRVIPYPENCYQAYTLCSRSGAEITPLRALDTPAAAPAAGLTAAVTDPALPAANAADLAVLTAGAALPAVVDPALPAVVDPALPTVVDPALPAVVDPALPAVDPAVRWAEAGKWAVPYLAQAEAQGVFVLESGFTAPVTREDFCQMALNILKNHGEQIEGKGAAGAVAIGLVSDGDGTKNIDREEAACIAARLIARTGSLEPAQASALAVYHDAAGISDWAKDSAAQMTACGLMNGSNDCFNPKVKITNEQAVTLMVRVNEYAASSVR